MSGYAICGDFYGQTITGIQRVAYETAAELDKIAGKGEIEVVVPEDAQGVPEYQNLKVVRISAEKGNRHLWIQVHFPKYLRKNHKTGITICNEAPLFRPGIAYIHDIYYKLFPKDFSGMKEKVSRAVVLMIYRAVAKRAKRIVTDSQTSREEIMKTYHVKPDRIFVIYPGWQHILNTQEDDGIFEKFPAIRKHEYYFTLGSLSKRKNVKWIIDYAAKHPGEQFLLSGKVHDFFPDRKPPENVILLGYVSDGEMISLMKRCKAFVFPTLYEGFGIPPLEALALGAEIVVSNRSCLPEVYKDAAHYFDPAEDGTELSEVLKTPVGDPQKLLSFYTWERAAKELYGIIKSLE